MHRRAKIVCTLGPAVDGPERLQALVEAGMDVARLNFSHGSHAEHARRFRDLRNVADRLDRPVAVLQDLCGPKIRTGAFEPEPPEAHLGDELTQIRPEDLDTLST